MKKFLSVLLFIVLTLSVLSTTVFASTNLDDTTENQGVQQEYSAATDTYGSLQMTNYKSHYLPTESIVPSFTVTHSVAIDSYSYINTGFSSVGITLDDNDETVLNVELSCSAVQSECSLQIDASLENGETVSSYVYALNNDYGTFISPFSIDNARERYYKYALDENIITQEEFESEWAELNTIYSETTESSSSEQSLNSPPSDASTMSTDSGTGIVKARFMWEDDNGISHPLRNIKVEVRDKGTILYNNLGTTYTDNEGRISLEVAAGSNVVFRIYAGDGNVIVVYPILNIPYVGICVLEEGDLIVPSGSETVEPLFTIDMSSDVGKAFQISQAALTARDYAAEMMGERPSDVTVAYPHDFKIDVVDDKSKLHGCSYQSSLKRIKITGLSLGKSYCPNSYASWDEIMHEYGHHVQAELGFFDNIGGGHLVDDPTAEHFKKHYTHNITCDRDCYIEENPTISSLMLPESLCKEKGCALAWKEAWASVFGNMAQEYYAEHLSGIDFVNDATYSSYRGFSYSYKFRYKKMTEDIEINIHSLLYDLYDNDTSDDFDNISFTYQEMWDYYTDSQAKTLYQFIEYIKSEGLDSFKASLGKLLNKYHLSTTAPTISPFNTDCPEVEFVWDEPNPSGYFNKRKYSVNFYNSSYDIIGSTIPQEVTLDSTGKGSIPISESLWQSVLNSSTTFYVSVTVGEYDGDLVNIDDNTFITEYESEYTGYSLSDLYETIYYDTPVTKTLDVGDYYWFKFTAPSTGEYIFESTGTTDTYAELFSGLAVAKSTTNRLTFNDDGGDSSNFKINYTLTKGDIVFLRVRGYSWTKTGEFSVKVTCPNHTHDYTYSYSRYTSTMHKAYCCCGASKTERHSFQIGLVINYCKHCGYTVSADTPVVKDSVEDELDPYGDIYYIPQEDE